MTTLKTCIKNYKDLMSLVATKDFSVVFKRLPTLIYAEFLFDVRNYGITYFFSHAISIRN